MGIVVKRENRKVNIDGRLYQDGSKLYLELKAH